MFWLAFAPANGLENKYTASPWELNLALLDYTGQKLYFTFHSSTYYSHPPCACRGASGADPVGSACPRAGSPSQGLK